MASLKRKNPTSPHAAASSSSTVPLLDKKLLPRINAYLDSLPPDAATITPQSIVDHLRRTHPEYARKAAKGFTRTVEKLCERMRVEAMQAEAAQDEPMTGAADDVVIIGSSVTPSANGSTLPAVSFAQPASSPSSSTPAAAAASSAASPSASAAAKRRKLASTSASSAAVSVSSTDGGAAEDGESSSHSSENDEEEPDLDVVEIATADANMANSAMRNLYNRHAAVNNNASGATDLTGSATPTTPGGADDSGKHVPNPQKPRERKSKEKVTYTTNSKKPVSAKKARQAAKVSNVHFNNSSGGPDDNPGGGGGGDNWHPEVLHPTSSYADLGGIESILQEIHELIEYPLSHPEIYSHLGVQPPRGVLLHGPPGCGKTVLAHAIAGELGVPLMKISAPEVVSGMSGESEQKIRTLFQDALEQAPCILFIDEIDAITPKRATAQREMERRIVAQLLTCMDSLSSTDRGKGQGEGKSVIVIGATNRPDSLDAALRRAGRFDREISLGIPDEAARARILAVMTRGMRVAPGVDWDLIAKKAVGYVGADLNALTREAAVIAINRIFRTVLPTPSLGPASSQSIESMMTLPPFNFLSSTVSGSPKIGAMVPPTPVGVQSDAARAVTASLQAAAAASGSTVPAAASSSPAAASSSSSSTVAHLIPDTKSAVNQADLSSRARASQKLRAHVQPLTEAQLAPLNITQVDFEGALKKVQPSSKREGFATVPDVTWNDIGALDELREELNMTILQPILNPKQFESIGLTVPAGVLLFGPPGCGKTLVAKAIANESGASFLSIKGPELLNQYVGQSERAVRKVFQRARSSAPCVIFFDELDALVPKRGSSGGGEGNNVSERVVNQLLTEMDGLEERRFVFVIAATNRPDMIDPAMLRPGRLDKLLYVKLPSAGERAAILRKHLRRTPLSDAVDINVVASDPRAEGFSGADVAALVREATLQALREAQGKARADNAAKGVHSDLPTWASMKSAPAAASASPTLSSAAAAAGAAAAAQPLPVLVTMAHFHFAFSKVFPSVSAASRAKYDRMHRMLCRARSTLSNDAPGGQTGIVDPNSVAAAAAADHDEKMQDQEEEEARMKLLVPLPTISRHITSIPAPVLGASPLPPVPKFTASSPPAAPLAASNLAAQGTILSSMAATTAAKPAGSQMDTQQ